MSGERFVGLSARQPVPRLLSVVGGKNVTKDMEAIDVDAPPLSSSDSSDNDGLSTRGNITSSHFTSSRAKEKSPPGRGIKTAGASRKGIAPANFTRTRASARSVAGGGRGTSLKGTKDQEVIDSDTTAGSPASKKPRRTSLSDGERGSQFDVDMFAKKPTASRRYGSRFKSSGGQPRPKASPTRRFKRPPKEPTPEEEDPDRYKLKLPSSPSGMRDEAPSPARKFKAIPDLASPVKSPIRKKRLRMPDSDGLLFPGELENSEASQRPVFTIPDELPESFMGGDNDRFDFALSQTGDALKEPNLIRDSTSPLTDLETLSPTPLCPLCNKEVDQAQLDEFKASQGRMTVAGMRRFCEQHRRRTARETWVQKGYPDIEWARLDGRIARHYGFLRRILADGERCHHGDLFRDAVREGRNRTLLQSDANLTPGYYGIRGLRAMTENLICEFAALLRRRSVEDRLIAARGHTMYLQAVLVPELAVRLIMEDMGVGVEEAREILTESSAVGELLNDEIPDVILSDDDDDDDDRDEAESG
ncbi:RTC4-like domain-containing protein [Chaetomium fimeti]|uniref:Restriction of telomere capping protein 4 n=1 Tax=Chaetomium fimeti TaxID=1854472 RepID=A0AAE0LWE8_9PEZI|nr:RTC4-like domain-containing protein [Chaetomium fimeti]